MAFDLLVDSRWTGDYGIGRYAREILSRLNLPFKPIPAKLRPGGPLDPAYLGAYMVRTGMHLYSPAFTPAVVARGRQSLTVHDLIHLDVAAERSGARTVFYDALVRPVLRRSQLTFTVSEFSRHRISEWAGITADRIVVASPGVSDAFLEEPIRPQSGDYALVVASLKPHKRVRLAIEAARGFPAGMRLVCVGVSGSAAQAQLGSSPKNVQFVPHCTDAELIRYYAGAACVLFPSMYEGFGLPALEALAVGVPVLYSAMAVREVVGDLATFLDPNEGPSEWADAVRHAVATRREFQAIRRAHARRFSWDSTASIVRSHLTRLVESG